MPAVKMQEAHTPPQSTQADEKLGVIRMLHERQTCIGCDIVIEPGGTVGLAAVLNHKIDIKEKTIVVSATGGNVDAASSGAALHAAITQK